MATSQQVKSLSVLAIVAGMATMGLSNSVAATSIVAAAITFLTGFGVAGIGALKLHQSAKVRG